MVKKKGKYAVIVLAIVALIIAISTVLIINSTKEYSPALIGMHQYAGALSVEIGDTWLPEHPYPLVASKTAIIDNYRIETFIDSWKFQDVYEGGDPIYICGENDCNGQFLQIAEKPEFYMGNLQCSVWDYDTTCNTPCWFNEGHPTERNYCQTHYGNAGYPQANDCSKDTYYGHGCYLGTYNVACKKSCGGFVATNVNGQCCNDRGCWWRVEIYKDNVLMNQSVWRRGSSGHYSIDNLDITMRSNEPVYYYSNCQRVENHFEYTLPKESFTTEIKTEQNGNTLSTSIKVQNAWKPVKANLVLNYELDTGLGTPSTETREKMIDLTTGENTYTEPVDFIDIKGKLKVTATLDIVRDGKSFSGVNGQCYKQTSTGHKDLSQCDYVLLGSDSSVETFDIGEMPETNYLPYIIIGGILLIVVGFFIALKKVTFK